MLDLHGIARRNLRARSGRTALTLAALAMAVALAVAMTVVGAAYSDAQLHAATVQGGYFDIQIRHFLPEQAQMVRERAAATPGIRSVTGSVTAPLLEFGPYTLYALAHEDPGLVAPYLNLLEGRLPRGPSEVALESWAARELGVEVGAQIQATTASGRPLTVTGLLEEMPGSQPMRRSWAIMSMSALEDVLGRPAIASQVNVMLEGGANVRDVHTQLVRQLGGAARIDLNEMLLSAREQARSLGRVIVAAVLFTAAAGVAVTLNTFQISLMERMSEIGILKSQGLSQKQLAGMWRLEGLILGVLGGAVGTAAGLGLAPLLSWTTQRQFQVSLPALSAPWWTIPGGVALGVAMAMLAAWIPARSAGLVPVLTAMKPWRMGASAGSGPQVTRLLPGGALTLAGLGLTALLPVLGDEQPVGLAAGIAGLFLSVAGVTVLTPYLLPVVLGRIARTGLAAVARANVLRHRKRTAVTVSSLLLTVTLLTFFSGFLHGQQVRAMEQLRARVPTDVLIEVPTFSGPQGQPGGLAAEGARGIGSMPAVADWTQVKLAHSLLANRQPSGPGGGRTVLVGIDAVPYGLLVGLPLSNSLQEAMRNGEVLITRRLAAEQALSPGNSVTVLRGGHTLSLRIAGIAEHEPEPSMGAILIDRSRLGQIDGNDLVHRILANLKAGQDPAAFARAARELVASARCEVISYAAERERLRREAAEMLAYVGAMVGLVGLISLSGIFNTFLASVRERTREIGILKSLGVSSGQISFLLCLEAAIMGTVASVLGIALGGLMAAVAAFGMSGEWSVAYLPGPALLAGIFSAAILLSVLASVWPARQAGRLDAARLMRAE